MLQLRYNIVFSYLKVIFFLMYLLFCLQEQALTKFGGGALLPSVVGLQALSCERSGEVGDSFVIKFCTVTTKPYHGKNPYSKNG